ncbi:unnamed protein product [Schistosoma turkestanicum]|nr:unnamed protein product [Schistosoma turkestanicum]
MSSGCCSDEQSDEDEDSDSSTYYEVQYDHNETLSSTKNKWSKAPEENNQTTDVTSLEYSSNSNESNLRKSVDKSNDWIHSFQKYLKISNKEANLYDTFIKCIRHDSDYGGSYIQPMHNSSSSTSTHISALPFELLLRIIRWTIGSHLNIRVLGVLACVCRGFYLLANDNSIWRDICLKLWPIWLTMNNYHIGYKNNTNNNNQLAYLSSMNYTSWREMAIYRPQVLFHGIYNKFYARSSQVFFWLFHS